MSRKRERRKPDQVRTGLKMCVCLSARARQLQALNVK